MTDADLDAQTAPAHYGAPAPTNLGGGFTVSDVDQPEQRHMCGRCRNPHTREGNPECPNRKADR